MIIPFLFVTLITILIASYVGAPMSLLPVIIVFYILMYLLGSRKKDEEKKFVVKLDNQARRQNFFFSDKDKSIFNQNTFPMIVLDKSYTITLSNVAFNSYVGKDANGLNLSLCLRSNELNTSLNEALANEKKSDINFMIYDQVHKYIRAQIFPLKVKKETFALVMMIDETSQKIAEKLKSDFVSNVSHELKTPLTAIMGFIETINGPAKDDPKQQEKFLNIIQTEAERMQRLVNDTLSLTRVEESEYQIPNEKVDLLRCANAARDSIINLANNKKIEILVDNDYTKESFFVKGNEDQITEIFENLLDNAITYSDKNTQIKIMFIEKENSIEFKIIDQGHGIPKDDIVRVSERFFRSKFANSYKKNSSGLGLAIVKHIVNRHAGNLYIESIEGEGSTFTVDIPKFDTSS